MATTKYNALVAEYRAMTDDELATLGNTPAKFTAVADSVQRHRAFFNETRRRGAKRMNAASDRFYAKRFAETGSYTVLPGDKVVR
jgi:hypothetical protein